MPRRTTRAHSGIAVASSPRSGVLAMPGGTSVAAMTWGAPRARERLGGAALTTEGGGSSVERARPSWAKIVRAHGPRRREHAHETRLEARSSSGASVVCGGRGRLHSSWILALGFGFGVGVGEATVLRSAVEDAGVTERAR
ncbi:hypothetical protein C8Q80DRAFT_1265580 [Daedaleopsis nitida]|nr:hypothetical protein C8Q80DRAFT_1265580 [Daedaleopsis nitida]